MSLEELLADAFLNFLMDRQVLDEAAARTALERQRAEIPPLGRVALGFLQEGDLESLLAAQQAAAPTLGAVLIEMGVIEAEELGRLKQAFLDLTGTLIC